MANEQQNAGSIFGFRWGAGTVALALLVTFAATIIPAPPAQAQTYSVLYNFTGGIDGANPAGVTVGPGGVLYGTAGGGAYGYGTVFRLSHVNSSWVLSPLYEFTRGSDGSGPTGVVIGPNGALYGVTGSGGAGYGTVFELRPPAAFCRAILCYWDETVLHTFTGYPTDGASPGDVNLAFDQAGDIYGTTQAGGTYGGGTTFELIPSGAGYTESILHNFGSGTDGVSPGSGVVLDAAGNVYGTTAFGGTGECDMGCGTVYQLTPSNGGWVENVLINFDLTNGAFPQSNLVVDSSGNLYGTTSEGGENGGGLVFKLTPSGGGWTYSVLYSFSSCFSYSGVTIDSAGNLFGLCQVGGAHQVGWVFELTNCSQTCTLIDLHDFNRSDGWDPMGTVVFDASRNLYGTAVNGGEGGCASNGCGVVWEITGVGDTPRH
jgi:uncharacterized repeat protein (TIGR03803 family)